MVRKTKKELCRDLDEIMKTINQGVDGLTNETSELIRNHIVKSLDIADKPDGYYQTRSRVATTSTITMLLILVIEYISMYALVSLYRINPNFFLCLAGITLVLFLFMPSADDLTEKIFRSDNIIVRKIFIPQIK